MQSQKTQNTKKFEVKPGESVEVHKMVFRVLPHIGAEPKTFIVEEGPDILRVFLPNSVVVKLERFGRDRYVIKDIKPNLWQILRTFGTREDVVYYIMPAAIITSRFNSFPVLFELGARPNIWVYFEHPIIKYEWFAEIGPY